MHDDPELPFDWMTHTEDGTPMPPPVTGLEQQCFEEEEDEELIVGPDPDPAG